MGLKQIRHSQREKWWTGKSVRRKHQDETWRDTRMEHTVEGIRDVEDKVRIEVLEGDERENRAGAIIWREKYLRNCQNWRKTSHRSQNPWEPQAG